jgi:hypothetical protein
MDEFHAAAKDFDARMRAEINMFDLGAALLLEYFSWPILRFTHYVPLANRQLISPLTAELRHLVDVAPDRIVSILQDDRNEIRPNFTEMGSRSLASIIRVANDPHLFDAMQSLGRGLDYRRRVVIRVKRMSIAIGSGVSLLNCAVAVAVFRSSSFTAGVLITGGWLSAMLFTMLLCRTNHHWKPRAGLRGNSS